MSRGLGKLQRSILEFITSAKEPVTLESIRWLLYEKMGKPVIPLNDVLPVEWNSSVARAVNSLALKSRSLRIEKRPLANFGECIAHYPSKTLSAMVRRDRQILLPALYEWTQKKNGAAPHYNSAENENYRVERLPKDRIQQLAKEWQNLESHIRPVFAVSGSNDLFLLIARGRCLFCKVNVDSQESFSEMVQKCCSDNILKENIAHHLKTFTDQIFPANIMGFLKLKSFIHEFAHIPARGQGSLKHKTLEELHQRQKSYIESLPGFQAADRRYCRDIQYSKTLHKLFDQTVFQKFKFLHALA
jgi:hypothetical protein